MATEITMPQMGFDMTEGVIANWLKAEGETVKKGDAIAEIETDKTTIQIEAFGGGVLRKIVAPAGAKVPVGDVIGIIADPGEALPPIKGQPAAASTTPAPAAQPAQAAAPAGGTVNATPVARRVAQELGVDLTKVKGSGPDGQITKADVEVYTSPAPAEQPPQPAPAQATGRIIATPNARKIAAEQNINLREISGSGPEGRIVRADVEAAAARVSAQPKVTAAARVAPPVVAPVAGRKPLTRIRQTIAQRMTQSKTTVPHFYITVQVEMDAALKLREQINEALKPENLKVSVNDLIVRATALALRRFPNLNASFAGDAVESHEQVHIGVAVALPGGLVTVTVRDADTKSLKQIAVEAVALATRARDGKAQPGDMGGQTFTISNLGMYGVESFVAIVNPPDAGILAIGASIPTPVVRDGQVVIRNIMHVTLSGDHRVTDGAEGAQFVNEVRRILENPWGLVL
ncbi:MAG: 2-oxo acid dehydrogenase subunit E2 [Chloroflexi bacterium]|nr:2-oxo acid dehydrogenase subunit E2 [Chloroflexota bacterium]MCL5274720.1 2-oxo acid dehydrogenase subunit E2 [Chloroflexota bacterium]